jgi:MFS transporter, BCD family, chlorophyll transporter
MNQVVAFLRNAARNLRLALPKLGVGWMFALLTSNFNRISIVELGVTAAIITTLIGMHHFLSPFQVIIGRFADRHPVWGMRRTPYLLAGATVASLVFPLLPSVAVGMSQQQNWAYLAAFALVMVFGICIAVMGDCHHSLIAEVTPSHQRSSTIAVVWTFTILSTIIAAGFIKSLMPEYSFAGMQSLYALTPLVVIGAAFLGVLGMERRLDREAMAVLVERDCCGAWAAAR